jgi:hypothetical protein
MVTPMSLAIVGSCRHYEPYQLSGHVNLVQLLPDCGASTNISQYNSLGTTALMMSGERGYIGVYRHGNMVLTSITKILINIIEHRLCLRENGYGPSHADAS